MELLVFVAALAIVAALAMWFGHDSRETAYSKEEEMATTGMRYDQPQTAPLIIRDDAHCPCPSLSAPVKSKRFLARLLAYPSRSACLAKTYASKPTDDERDPLPTWEEGLWRV
jgi:hypothetical protein